MGFRTFRSDKNFQKRVKRTSLETGRPYKRQLQRESRARYKHKDTRTAREESWGYAVRLTLIVIAFIFVTEVIIFPSLHYIANNLF